jgi:hypothetical protein
MTPERVAPTKEDWEIVQRMLPAGWQTMARELGALRRCRGFADPATLLRVLLIHLADGCSLRETAVRAAQGGLATVSDVALLKRLKGCGEWFRWMAGELQRAWGPPPPRALLRAARRIRVVDGSSVAEPGATGSTWRLHYAIELPGLQCDEVTVTEPAVGESFQRFTVRRGDLCLGDRGFAHRAGVRHVTSRGGAVIVRLNLTNLPLQDLRGRPFPLLAKLRTLHGPRLGDWPAQLVDDAGAVAGRVCALKKSRQAAQRARAKAARESAKQGHVVRPETLEAAGYTFVFTTLPAAVGPGAVLELYRGRWQVELAFKRLKSLLALGHLKKTDPAGAKAWLQGKLLVACLLEALITAGERFFPWGYPLAEPEQSLPVAGDLAHVAPV